MTRYVVIGTSGSGKTTLARQIAECLGIPHIELDALHWDTNWTEAPLDIMRERVGTAIAAPAWALDGNYRKVRDVVWSRATHLIWLDYPFPLVFWRIVSRTLRRTILQEELWNGNKEHPGKIFRRDGIIWWALTTYHRHKREYPEILARPEYNHLVILRFRTSKETERWLAELPEAQN